MENDKSVRSIGDDKHEEEEDERTEKFFQLIRSFREARNYYKRKESKEWELNKIKNKNKNKRMKIRTEGEDKQSGCNNYWVPKFEPEDFDIEVEFRKTDHHPLEPLAPLVFPCECDKDKDMKGEEDCGLDLRLAL